MESNGAKNVSVIENNEAKGSHTMIEIKIKTLDSKTYTLQVDKYVPVPELKEQIATATGILSEQQRLICSGKVLKDDQLFSAYDVEDGHTLHLVARQPPAPLGENASINTATDPASMSEHNEQIGVRQSLFIMSPDGDRSYDISELLSVFDTIEVTRTESGSEKIDATLSFDSLTSLTQNLRQFRLDREAIDRREDYTSQTAGAIAVINSQFLPVAGYLPAGLPTPASMAEVQVSTNTSPDDQIHDFVLEVFRYMETVTGLAEIIDIPTCAFGSETRLQNVGTFVFELGHVVMTLQMDSMPADSVIDVAPETGPNPMMVRAIPEEGAQFVLPGTSDGAVPVGPSQQSSGFVGGSVGENAPLNTTGVSAISEQGSSSHHQQDPHSPNTVLSARRESEFRDPDSMCLLTGAVCIVFSAAGGNASRS